MKTPALLALTSALFLIAAPAEAGPKTAQASRYYTQLLAAPAPDLAELGMLMNLLPKGGDLHHHFSGAIYAETYLDWVGRKGYCIYRKNNPALKAQKFRIETRPAEQLTEAARKICLSAEAVIRDDDFYRDLLKRWSDKDYGEPTRDQPAPDQQFFNTFGYFGPISDFDWHEGLLGLKARAKSENLQYLETMLKSAPAVDNPTLAARINALKPDAPATEIDAALNEYADFLAGDASEQKRLSDYTKSIETAAAGIDDADFRLRFQSYVSRNNPPATVFAGLYSAFASTRASKLIVGVNIVGPENGFVAMRDYALHMAMLRLLKQRFPEVKLALHAGELTLGMVPPEGLRNHIRTAVEVAGANRIGHGVDITYEAGAPELLDTLKARQVAVEINLTSNEFILGVKGAAHPVQVYRRHGVPFVISTDDAGVSRNNLSGEYLLYVSRYKPTYAELKATVYNSIRYAFLTDAEKAEETRKLDVRFNAFEAAVAKLASQSKRKR